MVAPTNFGSNAEAIVDNYFMAKDENPQQTKLDAEKEFQNYVEKLKEKNVEVITYPQCHDDAIDSIFPNNWFSTHKNENVPEGILIVYPMKSALRRLERNPKIIEDLKKEYKHFIDLTEYEKKGEYLEGTGSLLVDNLNKKFYCNL